MNASEKKLLYLAFFFAALGFFVRYSPLNQVPALEEFAFMAEDTPLERGTPVSTGFESSQDSLELKKHSKTAKKSKKTYSFPIAVNSASLDELCALEGVGPKLAENIIAQREKLPFRTGPDLKKVKGIGDKKMKNLLPYVIFD